MRKKHQKKRRARQQYQTLMREDVAMLFDFDATSSSTVENSHVSYATPVYATPRTEGQHLYTKMLQEDATRIVVCVGPAGTGKSMFACQEGVRALFRGTVAQIVLTRPAITAMENHGYLPGTLDDKMQPWIRPLLDIFEALVGKQVLADLRHQGLIEISPLAYMRGRTFTNAWIIADEMQNATPEQMLMLLTRLGEDSKLCITGDDRQSDLGTSLRTALPNKNGLTDLLNRACKKTLQYIGVIPLLAQDIQRSPAVIEVLTHLYQNEFG
jgi:phosphate starvation-inducible PhoH-like protein